jgi:hypothetical protein
MNSGASVKFRKQGTVVTLIFTIVATAGLALFYRNFHKQKLDFYSYRYQIEQNDITSYEKEFEKIRAFYLDKIKTDPRNAHDKAMLAHYYAGAGKEFSRDDYFDEAAKYALASLKQQPLKNPAAVQVLAELALARHESKRAQGYGYTLLKMDTQSPVAYSVLVESAITILRKKF